MIGWLIALVVFLLLLLLKVGVRILWDSESLLLKIRVGLLRFSLSSEKKSKKKKTKKKKQEKKPEQTAQPQGVKQKKEQKGMSPSLKSWLIALLERRGELLSMIGKVLTSPTLDILRLHIAVGGGDPEMTYGKICAGMGAGLPLLYNTFRVKKDDIQVVCRYDLSKVVIMAEVEATIRIGEVFALVGTVIGLLVKIYLTKKRNDKAVRTV